MFPEVAEKIEKTMRSNSVISDLNKITGIINHCFMFVAYSKKLTTAFKESLEMILMLSLLLNQNCNLSFLFNLGFY